ncbi:MAG: hypothetical protein K9H26_19395 [Prolixibacteraceae bacterium]|nr:hypothetical protein [Prolixibacteraceae bacterium]
MIRRFQPLFIGIYNSDFKKVASPGIYDFIGTYSGAGTYYEYDPNGNMVRDHYKNLLISYNDLNLPQQLDFANNDRINYFYNATGEKMLRAVNSDSVPELNINTYYFGPFVHEGVFGGSTSLKYILTPEGRILNKGTDTSPVWDWEYYLKDHLGNVRVVIAPTEDAGYSAVQQETHYYPYGMRISQLSNSANSTNKYLFSGKLLDDDFGLNWYSFGARNNYDAALGIWRSVDRLADTYNSLSPYNYCLNNPVRYVDPFGMDVRSTDSTYVITGDDIYNYYSYMQNVNEGSGSINNLYEALEDAASKNKGEGGAMATTVGEISVFGSQEQTERSFDKLVFGEFKSYTESTIDGFTYTLTGLGSSFYNGYRHMTMDLKYNKGYAGYGRWYPGKHDPVYAYGFTYEKGFTKEALDQGHLSMANYKRIFNGTLGLVLIPFEFGNTSYKALNFLIDQSVTGGITYGVSKGLDQIPEK